MLNINCTRVVDSNNGTITLLATWSLRAQDSGEIVRTFEAVRSYFSSLDVIVSDGNGSSEVSLILGTSELERVGSEVVVRNAIGQDEPVAVVYETAENVSGWWFTSNLQPISKLSSYRFLVSSANYSYSTSTYIQITI